MSHDLVITGFVLGLACLGGTHASFTFGDPIQPRSKLFNMYIACVTMGAAFSLVVTWLIEWQFESLDVTNGARAGIGCIVSCMTRFIIPNMISSVKDGSWKSWIPFVGKRT